MVFQHLVFHRLYCDIAAFHLQIDVFALILPEDSKSHFGAVFSLDIILYQNIHIHSGNFHIAYLIENIARPHACFRRRSILKYLDHCNNSGASVLADHDTDSMILAFRILA